MSSESSFRDEPPPITNVQPADEPPKESPLELTAEERQWAMLAHLSALIASAVAGMSFVGPLIVWLIKKDQSRFVDFHGKEALNFQLNMLIYLLILIGISFATCGVGLFVTIPLMIALAIYALIMPIIAGLKANNGEIYRYPATFRLIS